jgi:hypothetical protein
MEVMGTIAERLKGRIMDRKQGLVARRPPPADTRLGLMKEESCLVLLSPEVAGSGRLGGEARIDRQRLCVA